ncbi:MAG: putative rhamnosyl transferase, partial [Spirochaetales bacterium]|nr:putative rhamnosyl transferase [Spirochaetales bacterium]
MNSLSYQTDKNFKWYIFIDKNMPKIFSEKLNDITKESSLDIELTAVDCYSVISSKIKEITACVHTDCLITSRIDDDDFIHRDAI